MNSLRLDSLTVENFRSISGKWEIPLDAQVTLIHGPNGAGKTSLLSAIELAATGAVAFLDEQTPSAGDVLLNRHFPLGGVELRLRATDGATRLGAYELGGARRKGRPALDAVERAYFLERCFLPQTALGRLLEAYTASDKQIDTALIRFVKSVVGLDELDDVIDGLRAAGHVARTRAVSSRWVTAETRSDQLQADRNRVEAELSRAHADLAAVTQTLRSLVGDSMSDVDDAELSSAVIARTRRADDSEVDLATLEALRVRLAGTAAAYPGVVGDEPADEAGDPDDLDE